MTEFRINPMTDTQRKVIDYYDNTWLDYRALWMNKKDRAIHFGYYENFRESHTEALAKLNAVMANKAGITQHHSVLDAGCGQGGSSMWIAENIKASVTGITLVPHQVVVARRESLKRGLDPLVSFYEKDYANTGFDPESFDVVWACESLCHAPDKLGFYREAYRLLKPGGKIIIAEYIRGSRDNDPADESILRQWCEGWSMPDIETWEEHEKNMKDAGFNRIEMDDITKHTTPSLFKLYRMSKKLLNLGKFLHFTGIRNDVKHGNQLASMRQYEALEKKMWYYCLYTASKPDKIL